MRNVTINLRIAILSISLLTGIGMTWAITSGIKPKSVSGIKRTQYKPEKKYDLKLLGRFRKVLAAMETSRDEFFISGSVSIINEADESETALNIPYLYSRKGDDYYYRLASTETLNSNGLNIYVDHKMKRIVLSSQYAEPVLNLIPDMRDLLKNLKNEQYTVFSTVKGSSETISIQNEHHISCKEYSVSYDTLQIKVSRVFLRLTNLDAPLRTDNEKVVDYRINRMDSISNIDMYLKKSFVTRSGDTYVVTKPFSSYELIQM